MTLASGSRLGPYEILSALGAGGMGEVYRARDSKLNRDVALKVLPDLVADDSERRARFEREAQALAALNHPNIAQIYGTEESVNPSTGSGQALTLALVMELVEGPTVADLIASRGRLTVDEAVAIARQVADALEAAHTAGIVHRDLKPANIKVRPDGVVKVLDFGLARMVDTSPLASSAADSPTVLSPAATAHGVILGTAAYMAPEQARGRPADARADLWAFGVVVYEMLTGRALFSGATVSDLLASVMRDEPRWDALPPDTPSNVTRLLRRCLQKDPQLRLRHAGDARLDLTETEGASPRDAHSLRRQGRSILAAGVVLACAASAAVAWMAARRPTPNQDRPVRKWLIEYEASGASLHMGYRYPALSLDGRRVAYTDGSHLRIRDLDALEARDVPTQGEVGMPTWSPDSGTLAFAVNNSSLWKTSSTGGQPVRLCDLPPGLVLGMAWQPSGHIVVNIVVPWIEGRLWTVPETGGAAEPFTPESPEAKGLIWGLRGLPDGSLVYRVEGDRAGTIIEGAGRPPLRLQAEGSVGAGLGGGRWVTYSPSGHLLYEDGDGQHVSALPFDIERRQVTGAPFRVAASPISGAGPTVSRDGTLAHEHLTLGSYQLFWMDRRGGVLGRIGQPQQFMAIPAVSPDGRRVAVLGIEETTLFNIWVHDATRGTKSRLTAYEALFDDPAWMPDGSRVSFMESYELHSLPPDGGTSSRVLPPPKPGVERPGTQSSHDWSRDGKYLAFTAWGRATRKDIWALERASGRLQPVLQTAFNEAYPAIAPNSRYVAYISDETGQPELFVQAFPTRGEKLQLSTGGAAFPRWSPRGDEIFYVAGQRLMSVRVKAGSTLQAGTPQYLFDLESDAARVRTYDTLDGQQFVVARSLAPAKWGVAIIQNWFEEFRNK